MSYGARSIFEEMDQLRQDLADFLSGRAMSPALPFAGGLVAETRGYPRINVYETPERYTVQALAPGLDPASLHVAVAGNQVTISGTKPGLPETVDADHCHRVERRSAKFQRSLTLPGEVDRDTVRADYEDGILSIALPKAASARPRTIEVQVG